MRVINPQTFQAVFYPPVLENGVMNFEFSERKTFKKKIFPEKNKK